jgi:hypothetical protein
MKHIGTQFVDGFSLVLRSLGFLFKNPLFLIGSTSLLALVNLATLGVVISLLTSLCLSIYIPQKSFYQFARILDFSLTFFCYYIIAFQAYNTLQQRPYSFLSVIKSIKTKIVPFTVFTFICGIINLLSYRFIGKDLVIIAATIYISALATVTLTNKKVFDIVSIYKSFIRNFFWQLFGGMIGVYALNLIPNLIVNRIAHYVFEAFRTHTITKSDTAKLYFSILITQSSIVTAWHLIALCTGIICGVLLYQQYEKKQSYHH